MAADCRLRLIWEMCLLLAIQAYLASSQVQILNVNQFTELVHKNRLQFAQSSNTWYTRTDVQAQIANTYNDIHQQMRRCARLDPVVVVVVAAVAAKSWPSPRVQGASAAPAIDSVRVQRLDSRLFRYESTLSDCRARRWTKQKTQKRRLSQRRPLRPLFTINDARSVWRNWVAYILI